MSAVFVQKIYEKAVNQKMAHVPTGTIWVMDINKSALWGFNYSTYDHKINGSLVANTLLGLSKYYSSQRAIKMVNLWALCCKFNKVIFRTVD